MPGFFDAAQIRDALHNQALPAVEAIAANESLRSLRRFDRDDPPPYASSTDSERLDESLPRLSQEDIEALLDPPCTDEERYWVANTMQSSLSPGELYYEECRFEAVRLERYRFRHMIFRGKKGTRRFGVLVRRNVKRRWQKLGIWNPAWGFPGRNAGPNDKTYTWNWWWRQPGGFTNIEGKQLIDRALLLRQNLRRGESVPVLPRSHLQHDTTPSQADSFLLSRPWFLYRLESSEESEKHYRLDLPPQDPRPKTLRQHVRAWWKDRGDWRDDFSTIDGPLAWKWRHESPSPEPEPLEHFEPTSDEEDNPIETMELTPSEIDALEAIELPSSELPDKFWTISPGDHPPFFPGQQTAPAHVDISKVLSFLAKQTPRSSTPLPREHIEVPPLELQEAPSEPHRDTCSPPPQKPLRRGVDRPTPGRAKAQGSQHPPLPPRRSARIAVMKRPAEPLPSRAAPNKKPKTRATAKATATVAPQAIARETRPTKSRLVPARPPAGKEIETRLQRGRGRPRKGVGRGASSAVTKKPAAVTKKPAGRTTVSSRTRSRRERGD